VLTGDAFGGASQRQADGDEHDSGREEGKIPSRGASSTTGDT
jgi:hypothetical protein